MTIEDRGTRGHAGDLVARGSASTVASLFAARARIHPDRVAVQQGRSRRTYGELDRRTARLASALARCGLTRGSRLAVLSENRTEYLEVFLAAARLGAVVACPNWRLAPAELDACLELAAPELVFASSRHAAAMTAAPGRRPAPVVFGEDYERMLARALPDAGHDGADPEDRCSSCTPAAPPGCRRAR